MVLVGWAVNAFEEYAGPVDMPEGLRFLRSEPSNWQDMSRLSLLLHTVVLKLGPVSLRLSVLL